MQDYTLQQLSQSLASKAFSAVELSQYHLKKAHAAQSKLNAFISLDDSLTLAEAQAADARMAKDDRTPLTGIPIAHKDIFCAHGWRATAGSKMLANFVSPYNSDVVARFKAAGAVTLGKANCDEFAMGSTNESSAFGPVRNPWAIDHVPGGSSGGSAAIVAAGIAPGATATDTGGSIRQPASFSGITGIKPTYGRVSRYGMIAFASSLDQGGAMAKTAEDCALMLNVMAGFDARDSTSLPRADEDFTRHLTTPLAGLRIGVPREYFAEGLSESVAKPVLSAIDEFKKAGASVVDIGLPHLKLAVPVYYVIASAEASSNLSRFDGVRYGHRAAEYKDLHDMYKKSRAEGFGAEVKRRILVGTYVLSHGYYDAYYLQAQKIRRMIAQDFTDAFKTCDVIIGPVAPTPAYRLGEKNDDPVAMYLGDLYTIPASLAGLPGMSIPCGFTADNGGVQLPVGLQLVGNYFEEAKLLGIAHQYQQITDWHARVAPYATELSA